MTQRWTIRGIDEPTRDIVRRACAVSGLSAGEIVTQAIAAWASSNADLVEQKVEIEEELTAALGRLEIHMHRRKELLARIAYRRNPNTNPTE